MRRGCGCAAEWVEAGTAGRHTIDPSKVGLRPGLDRGKENCRGAGRAIRFHERWSAPVRGSDRQNLGHRFMADDTEGPDVELKESAGVIAEQCQRLGRARKTRHLDVPQTDTHQRGRARYSYNLERVVAAVLTSSGASGQAPIGAPD